ncbi:MAG: DUF4338 domain-containing protein [Deltaproteobacteria bacterium]|nr:DUF4338 domain-containing protein [Deltaproteobacteria bacterium]
MRLWLEQKEDDSECTTASILRLPTVHCSDEEKTRLMEMAQSRTIGIWRMKRAKVILGAIEGKPLERLTVDIRVPPESIVKCVEAFLREGPAYLHHPIRKPTSREARVEKMLEMLEKPSKQKGSDWKSFTVRYIGVDFTGPMIQRIRAIILGHPGATRAALARMVCQEFGVYSRTGKLHFSTFTDILKRMDMDNIIRLPEVTSGKSYLKTSKKSVPHHPLLCKRRLRTWHHRDIEPVVFVPIQNRDQQHLWNDMMSRFHYLKRPRLFGPQLRYLIYGNKSNGRLEAPGANNGLLLGAIGFSPAAWQLADRDTFIGWNTQQRQKGLSRIIGNSRFLILPWIRCPNLASIILGRAAKRVSADWKAAYGIRPVLLETFVQQERFHGTCYRAANWIEVGETDGYSYFSSQKKKRSPKTIFLFPLCKNFRSELCKEL